MSIAEVEHTYITTPCANCLTAAAAENLTTEAAESRLAAAFAARLPTAEEPVERDSAEDEAMSLTGDAAEASSSPGLRTDLAAVVD